MITTPQKEMAFKWAIRWFALPAGFVFALEWQLCNRELPLVGIGPDGALAFLAAFFLWWLWVLDCVHVHAAKAAPDYWKGPMKVAGATFVAAPFCIIIGRVVFSCVPFVWSNSFGAFVGLLAALRVSSVLFATARSSGSEVVRGTPLVTQTPEYGQTRGSKGSEQTMRWGGLTPPRRLAAGGLLVAGARSTGKTLQHRAHMASVLRDIRPGSDLRAVIYDVKADLISELGDMNLNCNTVIMNPFDRRACAWDLAADITGAADAKHFAEALFPDPTEVESGHWVSSSRDVVAGIINGLNKRRPGEWRLRHLIRVSAFRERFEPLLAGTDVTSYFKPEKTFANTLNTIRTVMGALEPVAALWENTPRERRLSLHDWMKKGDSILVLGGHESLQPNLAPINRVMFRVLADDFSEEPESQSRERLWFYCDELRYAGRLDLPLLINNRSKGSRVVLGFQDLPGLYKVYGRELAREIVGAFQNVSFLKLSCSETARWASERTGEVLVIEETPTVNERGELTGTSRHLVKRETVMAGEFLDLKSFDDGRVEGVHRMSGTEGAILHTTQYEFFLGSREGDFVRRDKREEELAPWSDADAEWLYGDEASAAPPAKNGKRRSERAEGKEGPEKRPPDIEDFGRFSF